MNLPNFLTCLRFVLTGFFIYVLTQPGLSFKVMALILFCLAMVTDFLDGYFARKMNCITAFGKLMDPIADKFIVLSAFFIFTGMHIIAVWVFVLIALREVGITIWRLRCQQKGVVLAAEKLGKYKTVFQTVTIILILVFIVIAETNIPYHSGYNVMNIFFKVIQMCVYATLGITVVSGVSFIWNNRGKIYER